MRFAQFFSFFLLAFATIDISQAQACSFAINFSEPVYSKALEENRRHSGDFKVEDWIDRRPSPKMITIYGNTVYNIIPRSQSSKKRSYAIVMPHDEIGIVDGKEARYFEIFYDRGTEGKYNAPVIHQASREYVVTSQNRGSEDKPYQVVALSRKGSANESDPNLFVDSVRGVAIQGSLVAVVSRSEIHIFDATELSPKVYTVKNKTGVNPNFRELFQEFRDRN